ncbi:MAG: M20/M25/M40 family metallo-hydrolase, partial [Candidatus Thorarchaeota archaeon]
AQLDMRTVMGQTPENLLEQMNKRVEQAGLSDRVRVEYIHGKPAVLTPENTEIVQIAVDQVELVTGKLTILSSATYGTDCSVLQPKVGIMNVICGPGSIEQAHQPNEFINVDQLYQSIDVYLGIARKFDR